MTTSCIIMYVHSKFSSVWNSCGGLCSGAVIYIREIRSDKNYSRSISALRVARAQ